MTQAWKRREVIGDCVLYQGDCLEVMPTLGAVDAVVTDPPYGVNYNGSTTKHGENGYAYNGFEDTPKYIETVCVPALRMAAAMSRSMVATPGNANAFKYDQPRAQGAIFYPSGANAGPWGFVCSQPLFYYGKDPFLMLGKGSRPNGFSTTEATDRTVAHPCPKPEGQTRWMVQRVSFTGETILDPFMGSGTTLVACAKLGRKGIGIELDPDYFEIACRRVEEAYRQPDLFIEPPKKPEQEAMDL